MACSLHTIPIHQLRIQLMVSTYVENCGLQNWPLKDLSLKLKLGPTNSPCLSVCLFIYLSVYIYMVRWYYQYGASKFTFRESSSLFYNNSE